MVLKVRGGVPVVWRTPDSLQFGVDEPLVVLEELGEGAERLVAALGSGISRSGFDMMARGVGLGGGAAAELLRQLEPVLEREDAPRTAARVVVGGEGPLADEVRRLLEADGVLAGSGEERVDLAVIVAGWVIGAEDHGRWLRRDIPHLPVVIGDAGVTIGPLVEPGSGPCLYCVQLTRTDQDAAWPAIATQLWSRAAPTLGRLAVSEAAVFAVRRIEDRLSEDVSIRASRYATNKDEATSWRIGTRGGAISSRVWTRHAACRCAAPEESDWAPAADLDRPLATTTGTAAASRA